MEEENKVKKFIDYVDRKFTHKKDDLMDLVQDHFYLFLTIGLIIVGFVLILLFFRRKRKKDEDRDEDEPSRRNWNVDRGRIILDERTDGEEK